MKIDPALRTRVEKAFEPLNKQSAVNSFPPPASLSLALNKAMPNDSGVLRTNVDSVARLFTTASVDMWMRAVHSFLISASLTDVSPIWASTAGYYSSHYSVRAVAHLLGFFQLFHRKRNVHLQLEGGRYVCSFVKKGKNDREHAFYWKIVKDDTHFIADPFFTQNDSGSDRSDVGHRDRGNYADHLPRFNQFRPLDANALKARIEKISDIEVGDSPPIPQISQFPDLESVQIMAYHRLVRFRDLVDAVLGGKNKFWNAHRNPTWAREFMDFQLTEKANLSAQFTLV